MKPRGIRRRSKISEAVAEATDIHSQNDVFSYDAADIENEDENSEEEMAEKPRRRRGQKSRGLQSAHAEYIGPAVVDDNDGEEGSADVDEKAKTSGHRSFLKGLTNGRKRKPPKAKPEKKQPQLVRAPFSEDKVACPVSIELWVVIDKKHNGRFYEDVIYPVNSDLFEQLCKYIRPVKLQVIINRNGNQELLYTKLVDGYENDWMESAEACSEQLEQQWGSIQSGDGEYIFKPARRALDLPDESDFMDLGEAIELAFGDRIINSLDHPILEELGLVTLD